MSSRLHIGANQRETSTWCWSQNTSKTFWTFQTKDIFMIYIIPETINIPKKHILNEDMIPRLKNCISNFLIIVFLVLNPSMFGFYAGLIICSVQLLLQLILGSSINGLVTNRNTKLCCRGFILELSKSTTANKIDSEHTQDYNRLLPVCEAEIFISH